MSDKQSPFSWPMVGLAFISLAALISVTFVLVAARIKTPPQSDTTPGHRVLAPPGQSKPEKKDPAERVEMVQITVRPTGFEPTDLEYPAKPFLLAIDNQSGMDNLELALLAQNAEGRPHAKVRDFKMSLTALSKREVIVLNPGRYVLKETNHPDWTCQLTISQK